MVSIGIGIGIGIEVEVEVYFADISIHHLLLLGLRRPYPHSVLFALSQKYSPAGRYFSRGVGPNAATT